MALFPETPLSRCAACEELVRVADPACPHCGAARARAERATSLVALAAALAVAGCGPPEPEYGVPLTDSTGSATDANATEATTTETSTEAATEATTEATSTEPTDTTAPTTTDATGTGTAGAVRPDASEREPRDPPRVR